MPPSLVRCLSSFGSITTCAHGHAIKRSPQHLRLSHFGIVNTPNMHDNLFRPYVAIMTGSCDNLHMKYSSMSAGTPAYRAGSTAIFEPNVDVRGEITLKLFNMKTAGAPKLKFVINLHCDTLSLTPHSPSASSATASASASGGPSKVVTIVRCPKSHIDGVEFDERYEPGFAIEFVFTHLPCASDSHSSAAEGNERDIRNGGVRALYPGYLTRIKCARITCGHVFAHPSATSATSASDPDPGGRVQCPNCKTTMCVPFMYAGERLSRPIPARREVTLDEQPLARSAPQPRRALSHSSRLQRSLSLTDGMGGPLVPPPSAPETFTPDNENDIRVGARVRALWLGQDRHRWPDWYLATVTAAHPDGSFSLLYDDGYRGYGVPRTAIRCSVEHHIVLLREMFPAVPFSVLKQCVSEADTHGFTQEQLVDAAMRINEAYNSQPGVHAGHAAPAAGGASASATTDTTFRPATQAELRAGVTVMTPVGVGTMLQFRERDKIVIVKLPWCVSCVHLDRVGVIDRPADRSNAPAAAASAQRAQQILLDEILAHELSIAAGSIPQSPALFTDHVVGPEDSRIGPAQISQIVNLPTFKFSMQISSCVQTSNMMCTVCQCDFEEGELLRTLPCNHVYHVECIDPWLRMKKVCPICNIPIDHRPVT